MGVYMKTLRINQFDGKDEEIAEALISLGMNRTAAMTLAYMQNTNSATSIELERSSQITSTRSKHSYEAIKRT